MDPGPSTPSKKRSKWEDHEDESETLQPPIRPQKRRAKAKSSRKTGELRASEQEAAPDDQQAPPPKPRTRSIYVPERTLHPPIQSSRSVSQCYEILNQIEEGSYGVVFRARDVQTGDIVALKRLKLDEEKNGFPITALREIYALMTCRHENVVRVREVVVGETLTKCVSGFFSLPGLLCINHSHFPSQPIFCGCNITFTMGKSFRRDGLH